METSVETCANPNCESCRNNFVFEMPEAIPTSLTEGKLALFAGAGISTESRGVFPQTFYEEIASEIGADPLEELSFPAVMSRFCKRHGRRELLIRIRERFDYLKSFPEVRLDAARFHQALSTIPFIEEIFTTNWDELFEEECGAIPIVTGEDYAFWNLPGRKVFKLHGSASHYGSIVATEEDYEACLFRLRSGLIGSSLKLALATKTILFVGYSARDPDFLQVLQLVRDEIGSLTPPMYAVTLNEADRPRLESLGLETIVTDATYFVEELKKVMIREEVMLDDSWLENLSEILDWIREEHRNVTDRFNCVEHPTLVYTLSYQDGIRHGIELLLARARTGELSHPCYLTRKVKLYERMKADRRKRRRYNDVAYIEGYSNALILPLVTEEERRQVPPYYAFGYKGDLYCLDELATALSSSRHLHRGAYEQAKDIVRRRGNDPEIILHHTPFLW